MVSRVLVLLFVIVSLFSCSSNSVKITGTIDPSVSDLYLFYDGDTAPFAEIKVDKGKFEYSGKIDTTDMAIITNSKVFDPKNQNLFFQHFIMEPGDIEMTFDIVNPLKNKITGTLNSTFSDIIKQTREFSTNPLLAKAMNGDSSAMMQISELQAKLQKHLDSIFVKNKDNILSLVLLPMLDPTKLDANAKQIDSNLFKYTKLGRGLKQEFFANTQAIKTNITTLPTQSLYDLNGSKVSFESLKGKITLIDFWAYWCAPCRKASVDLKTLYGVFKDKVNFVSISLDPNQNEWKKAIKEDGLTWQQLIVPNNQQEVMNLANHYGIQGIPHVVILAPNGHTIHNGLTDPNQIGDILYQATKEK